MTSGRMKHDAKITVYLTHDELLRLDQTLLEVRRLYGVKTDRSRYVREAILGTAPRRIAERIREGTT